MCPQLHGTLHGKRIQGVRPKLSSPTDLCDISNFTKEVRIGKVFKLQIDLIILTKYFSRKLDKHNYFCFCMGRDVRLDWVQAARYTRHDISAK